MIVSYNWLNEWIDIELSPEELGEKMTGLGMEVDEIRNLSEGMEDFVVATIEEIDNIFNGSRNRLLKINNGGRIVNIVSSASNVKEGDQIVWAAPGTILKGVKIESRNFNGIKSEGMALSLEELGLEEKSEGLVVFDKHYKNGTSLREIPLFSDSLIVYEITPNRGDLLSHLGLARELSAYFGKSLKRKEIHVKLTDCQPFDLEIRTQNVFSYYCASVEGIRIEESPLWLKLKLLKCGMRPLYNIIDITNYIMLDTGQPMHAFDLDKLNEKIIVRDATDGESVETLDGVIRELPKDSLVIADNASAVAVAGVMGGENSKITPDTRNILFEAAVFDPVSVRRTSKKMNLPTDASFRFERGIDRLQTSRSLAAAINMTTAICGGRLERAAFYDQDIKSKRISLDYKKVSNYIGVEIDKKFVDKTLNALGISKESETENEGVFKAPSYRHDIESDVDLIEEIARFYGYDKIEPTVPYISLPSVKIYKKEQDIADLLATVGFSQVINYSFLDKSSIEKFSSAKPIELANPINADQSVMRTSLIPGLFDNLITNLNYGSSSVMIFEIGTLFFQTAQKRYLGILAGGNYPLNWHNKKDRFDFYDIKGVIELIFAPDKLRVSGEVPGFLHPTRSASLIFEDKTIGYIGELHPGILSVHKIDKPVIVAEVDLECLKDRKTYSYKKIDRLLPIRKDIAFIVDRNIYAQSIIDAMLEVESVKDAVVFDLYQGKGIQEDKKSIAFNVLFDNNVKDNIQEELNRLAEHLQKRLGARLRR